MDDLQGYKVEITYKDANGDEQMKLLSNIVGIARAYDRIGFLISDIMQNLSAEGLPKDIELKCHIIGLNNNNDEKFIFKRG